MPLSTDEKLLALGEAILEQFQSIFGAHPGFRPVHAKGLLLAGTFTPDPQAASLTRAPHVARATPVIVRFSDTTGLPLIPDNDPNATPRGIAIRFKLAEHVHTDIIGHSTNGFPAKDGSEFLAFLRALATSPPSLPSPSPIESFLAAHPAALAFVQPRPYPSSFAREAFFGITALRFINQAGAVRHGRFRVVPDAGLDYLDDATRKVRDGNYLFDELKQRIAAGPIALQIRVQLANDGDIVDDSTQLWPEDRPLVNFGKVVLSALVPNDAHEQKTIIFDPLPRVDGIEPSDDPLLELRAAVYLLSGRRRRQAAE
jgi:catalase